MPIPSASAAGSPPPQPATPKSLNRRQEKFSAHYALTGNATEAARLAGYAERSAANHGFRLIRDPRVRERIYTIRVNRAIQFGPVTAFSRLENLYRQASEAGAWRAAAFILTLQARLAGLESWNPPPAKNDAKSGGRPRRGAFGPRGADPFDDLSENDGFSENDGPEMMRNDDE